MKKKAKAKRPKSACSRELSARCKRQKRSKRGTWKNGFKR